MLMTCLAKKMYRVQFVMCNVQCVIKDQKQFTTEGTEDTDGKTPRNWDFSPDLLNVQSTIGIFFYYKKI